MKTVNVSLNSISRVKALVNEVSHYDCDCDFNLASGRYVIDAKSMMGVFSLDLSKPMELRIHSDDIAEAVLPALEPFIVKTE